MPVNLITHNAEFFSLPSDFLPIPTQIVNSVKGNYVDYCYSETMQRNRKLVLFMKKSLTNTEIWIILLLVEGISLILKPMKR